MLSGYGRELFATFAPPSARARLDARKSAVPLLSGALVARHGAALAGAVVEVTWSSRPALAGFLRAARHHDLVVAVGVPAAARAAGPHAPRAIVDEIIAAADAALFDRPLIIVARAMPLPPGASVERLSEGLYRDVDAGFTSIAFSPAAFAGDVDELVRVTAPLVEQDLGLEVELAGAADAALVLARIDDAGLSLAAVRGANAGDELAGALLVVDAGHASLQAGGSLVPARAVALRVVLDDALGRTFARAGEGDDERTDAIVFMDTAELLGALDARGTAPRGSATRLLDALAASMR